MHYALDFSESRGDLACDFARAAGIDLLPYQRDMLNEWGARGSKGYIHRTIGASIPRQAGKSTAAIAWALFRAIAEGAHVLWSDHNYSTTCEMLARFRAVLGKRPNDPDAFHPEFNAFVSDTSSKTAQERFEFTGGGVLCFATRTKSASLGYSFDMVIYDEAQELTDEQQQAIIPTTSSGALHDMQSLYVGTPTRPGSPGVVFSRIRKSIAEKENKDACWWEWGVSEIGDTLDDTRLYAVNPALPDVADIEAIKTARNQMGELEFAQEYLGYWLPSSKAIIPAIPRDAWQACATDKPAEGDPVSWGVKFSPDGSDVAVCVATSCAEGIHLELAARKSTRGGSLWLVKAISKRADDVWVIDGKGQARALIERLPDECINAFEPKAAEVIEASAAFLDAVREGTVRYFKAQTDETDQLTASVESSPRRKIGSGGGWGFGGADAAPVEAAALAYWAACKHADGDEMEVFFG